MAGIERRERIADLAGLPRQAGELGDLAVGRDPALGYARDDSVNARPIRWSIHGPSISQYNLRPMPHADFSCRLCDGERLSLYYSQGNEGQFRYFRCGECGLVNLDLSAGIDQTQCHEVFHDPTNEASGFDRMLDASFEFISRHLPNARSLCDIGCGNGRLLYLAQRDGWKVFGLELTEDFARQTADRLGIEIVAGNFLDYEPPSAHAEAYDVVCLRHVLEHLPDSRLAMQKISALLKPGGHALLEFPNVEGFDKRIKRFAADRGLHKRRYKEDFMPGHCNEFCRASFEFLLSRTGFELVHWETYSKKPLSDFIYRHLHIGNKARALVRKLD